ncbi:MAG TPA: class I SAM-dependent methyltransferase [Solirubrobacteraceae bacterium]|nr:class I SAM-dependent methyltransferase [Solirubrobacteraceae bacterium]
MSASGEILGVQARTAVERTGLSLAIRGPDGNVEQLGRGEPQVEVAAVNADGLAALRSRSELRIAEAYLNEDIDISGDLVAAMRLRVVLSDVRPLLRARTFLQPLVLGRRRLNPRWIAKHYDSENMQLYGIDELYNVYTPGLYERDDDTLEEGAVRKLEHAFDRLGLRAGATLLDVGCGWGGFLRYCAERGVEATGISLSRHQLAYARSRLDGDGLDAHTLYQDFFTYEPHRQFDAISLMGSIEDLANYRSVMLRLGRWLRPGGRIYMDFAAKDRPWGISTFISQHVWPGAFRLVYLPSFTRALARSHFDVVALENDRRNYHLWPLKGLERWTDRRAEIVAATDERTWRLMSLLMAGAAHLMGEHSILFTAYRVTLESRAAPQPAHHAATVRDVATRA